MPKGLPGQGARGPGAHLPIFQLTNRNQFSLCESHYNFITHEADPCVLFDFHFRSQVSVLTFPWGAGAERTLLALSPLPPSKGQAASRLPLPAQWRGWCSFLGASGSLGRLFNADFSSPCPSIKLVPTEEAQEPLFSPSSSSDSGLGITALEHPQGICLTVGLSQEESPRSNAGKVYVSSCRRKVEGRRAGSHCPSPFTERGTVSLR